MTYVFADTSNSLMLRVWEMVAKSNRIKKIYLIVVMFVSP